MNNDNLWQKKWRDKHKEQGLCTNCNTPVVPGKTLCKKHLDFAAEISRIDNIADKNSFRKRKRKSYTKRNLRLKKDGLCIRCLGKMADREGKLLCSSCQEKQASRQQCLIESRLRDGLCKHCGLNKVTSTESVICNICYMKRTAYRFLGSQNRFDELQTLFDNQKGVCPYTGIKLILGVNVSLDHIIPKSKGGRSEVDNFQWVYGGKDFDVNIMKNNFSCDEFLKAIKIIYEYRSVNL